MNKKIIKNGTIVTAEKTFQGDIRIEGSVITGVEESIKPDGTEEIIDAAGFYVMPGGVDVHTHLNLKLGDRQVSDGFYAGTRAAAFGGTTTVIDHPEAGPEGCSLHHQPNFYRANMEKEAVVDYGIHGVFQHVNESVLAEIPELIEEGYSSMKVYTTYANKLEMQEIFQVLKTMTEHGGITAFHAEVDEPIQKLRDEFAAEGKLEPVYHAKSRPDTAESDAIVMILEEAKKVNASIYIVHLSSEKGLQVIKEAKKEGHNITAETCTQYLVLDESCYLKENGLDYVMAPPLRSKADQEALWRGLADGSISVAATDHCSFSHEDKVNFGQGDFRSIPGGSPGVETRLPILFSEGVLKHRFNINRFVEVVSTGPARKMGLYPQKGCLQPGSDADLILWDAEMTKKISVDTLHQKCDYTPFEGMEVTGWPVMTILRGKVIVKDGEFFGEKGSGKFIKRKGSFKNSS
jgi:dihydropyrimidinase